MSKMTIWTKIFTIVIVAGALGLILRALPTRNEPRDESARVHLEKDSKPLCGGYTEVREPSDEEYQLFRSVTGSMEGMTFTPLTVQTQVVAGINYKFYCRYSDITEEDNPGHCYLTIYKPLPGQGEPTITSIEKINTTEHKAISSPMKEAE